MRQSNLLWWDDAGTAHEILQSEGVEQGDPLAPALWRSAPSGSILLVSSAFGSRRRGAAQSKLLRNLGKQLGTEPPRNGGTSGR